MSVSKTPPARRKPDRLVLELARTRPLFRARDAVALGVHTGTLTRLVRAGTLQRVGAGRYQLPAKRRITEHHDLVVATNAVPRSVVCLVSALRFHGIGTQLPHQVWLAVPRGARVPRLHTPPLRVVNISPARFNFGVEEHRIEGHNLRVYGIVRTIADCFRFRNTVGLDVALEALTEAWRSKRLNLDELTRMAKRLRVQRVMQPYLETMVL